MAFMFCSADPACPLTRLSIWLMTRKTPVRSSVATVTMTRLEPRTSLVPAGSV